MAPKVREALIELLEPSVTAMGYELVELELVGSGGNRTLRLYVDAPGGVTLEDCEAVSDRMEEILDAEDPIPGSYRLEVSSPGINRPLRRLKDYERFRGEKVKLKTFEAIHGQRSFTGELVGLEEENVLVDTPEGRRVIPWEQIAKARLVADL